MQFLVIDLILHCSLSFLMPRLMAENNHLSEAEAIRELAKHTKEIVEKFSELAISYNINIITGSMPEIIDDTNYTMLDIYAEEMELMKDTKKYMLHLMKQKFGECKGGKKS